MYHVGVGCGGTGFCGVEGGHVDEYLDVGAA
jgi:hypothetical protein